MNTLNQRTDLYKTWELYTTSLVPYTKIAFEEVIYVVVNTKTSKIHSCWASLHDADKTARDLSRRV